MRIGERKIYRRLPARSLCAIGLFSFVVPGVSRAASPQTTIQPSLAINYIVLTGATSNSTGTPIPSADGDVDMFAGNFVPNGTVAGDGSSLSTTTYANTYANIGNAFGTNGPGTFNVPNLSGATPIGSGQGAGLTNRNVGDSVGVNSVTLTSANVPTSMGGQGQSFTNMQPSLALNEYICVTSQGFGGDNTPMLGEIVMSGSNTAPVGCVPANGAMLSTAIYSAYYAQVGSTFGSSGANEFAVPDLQGRAAVGVGNNTQGRTSQTLGNSFGAETNTLTQANYPAPTGSSQAYSNIQPSLALHYLIALEGVFPSHGSGTGAYKSDGGVLGQIILYTGSTAPDGWSFCDGQTLSINQNSALYALLGTTYGGNGQTTFQLPNLDANLAVGVSSSLVEGEPEGVERLPTNANELPPAVPEPTCVFLLPLGALLARRRR